MRFRVALRLHDIQRRSACGENLSFCHSEISAWQKVEFRHASVAIIGGFAPQKRDFGDLFEWSPGSIRFGFVPAELSASSANFRETMQRRFARGEELSFCHTL
jgi:hypothetical protein